MKRLIVLIISTVLTVPAYASHDWVFLDREGQDDTVYYWSDIRQDPSNSSLKIVCIVLNEGQGTGSTGSTIVLNCADATFSFENVSKYSQHFACGEILQSSTGNSPFWSVQNTPAILLYDLACPSR